LTDTVEHEELLTVGEVTGLLGVSRTSVQKMVDSGVLLAMRTAGGHRRIVRSSVQALLSGQLQLVTAAAGPAALAPLEPVPSMTVLVVEDNPTTALSYQKVLRRSRLPISCEFATDGIEALLKLERFRPDVLITDLQMEPVDGFRLVAAVQNDAELALMAQVVVTGLDDDEIARRGGLPPNVLLYRKPVPWDRVLGFLEAHAQRRQLLLAAAVASGGDAGRSRRTRQR
jgi:excisionase family DNA binding protein